jgi:hypothetical protein
MVLRALLMKKYLTLKYLGVFRKGQVEVFPMTFPNLITNIQALAKMCSNLFLVFTPQFHIHFNHFYLRIFGAFNTKMEILKHYQYELIKGGSKGNQEGPPS